MYIPTNNLSTLHQCVHKISKVEREVNKFLLNLMSIQFILSQSFACPSFLTELNFFVLRGLYGNSDKHGREKSKIFLKAFDDNSQSTNHNA